MPPRGPNARTTCRRGATRPTHKASPCDRTFHPAPSLDLLRPAQDPRGNPLPSVIVVILAPEYRISLFDDGQITRPLPGGLCLRSTQAQGHHHHHHHWAPIAAPAPVGRSAGNQIFPKGTAQLSPAAGAMRSRYSGTSAANKRLDRLDSAWREHRQRANPALAHCSQRRQWNARQRGRAHIPQIATALGRGNGFGFPCVHRRARPCSAPNTQQEPNLVGSTVYYSPTLTFGTSLVGPGPGPCRAQCLHPPGHMPDRRIAARQGGGRTTGASSH